MYLMGPVEDRVVVLWKNEFGPRGKTPIPWTSVFYIGLLLSGNRIDHGIYFGDY